MTDVHKHATDGTRGYDHYLRMLQVGIPESQIRDMIEADGADPSIVFGAVPVALKKAEEEKPKKKPSTKQKRSRRKQRRTQKSVSKRKPGKASKRFAVVTRPEVNEKKAERLRRTETMLAEARLKEQANQLPPPPPPRVRNNSQVKELEPPVPPPRIHREFTITEDQRHAQRQPTIFEDEKPRTRQDFKTTLERVGTTTEPHLYEVRDAELDFLQTPEWMEPGFRQKLQQRKKDAKREAKEAKKEAKEAKKKMKQERSKRKKKKKNSRLELQQSLKRAPIPPPKLQREFTRTEAQRHSNDNWQELQQQEPPKPPTRPERYQIPPSRPEYVVYKPEPVVPKMQLLDTKVLARKKTKTPEPEEEQPVETRKQGSRNKMKRTNSKAERAAKKRQHLKTGEDKIKRRKGKPEELEIDVQPYKPQVLSQRLIPKSPGLTQRELEIYAAETVATNTMAAPGFIEYEKDDPTTPKWKKWSIIESPPQSKTEEDGEAANEEYPKPKERRGSALEKVTTKLADGLSLVNVTAAKAVRGFGSGAKAMRELGSGSKKGKKSRRKFEHDKLKLRRVETFHLDDVKLPQTAERQPGTVHNPYGPSPTARRPSRQGHATTKSDLQRILSQEALTQTKVKRVGEA